MRLIDVEAFSKEMKNRYCTNCDSYNGVRCRACWVDDMISDVEDFPTVDAEPVRHGHWVRYRCFIKCSSCGKLFRETNGARSPTTFLYCPECGAKMDEVK